MPLLFEEPGTPLVQPWLRDDPELATWALTRLELASAVERRAREGRLSAGERRAALDRVRTLGEAWHEVQDLGPVRARAMLLVARHPLRAADAAQLAAALLVAEVSGAPVPFVCLDQALAAAAEREGLEVLTWPDRPTR